VNPHARKLPGRMHVFPCKYVLRAGQLEENEGFFRHTTPETKHMKRKKMYIHEIVFWNSAAV